MMHGDSRVMVVVCLETASLPAPCLSTSTSPRSREEPFLALILRGLEPQILLSEQALRPGAGVLLCQRNKKSPAGAGLGKGSGQLTEMARASMKKRRGRGHPPYLGEQAILSLELPSCLDPGQRGLAAPTTFRYS